MVAMDAMPAANSAGTADTERATGTTSATDATDTTVAAVTDTAATATDGTVTTSVRSDLSTDALIREKLAWMKLVRDGGDELAGEDGSDEPAVVDGSDEPTGGDVSNEPAVADGSDEPAGGYGADYVIHAISSESDALMDDGYVVKCDPDWYCVHWWTAEGDAIHAMQPGDTVLIDEQGWERTVVIDGEMDISRSALIDSVRADAGYGTVLLQTCYSPSCPVMLVKYGHEV
jgi:hypothetical protein